ncbi:hypothetical protein TVAG_453080 [Trichomonas vaginalis G3]|uniref:Uncharacterized protein n=1 Tax=Trichomonas vaginalis (strain ATCC PRA-98 / G3) TaxID=412133 RepID=A2ES54_TRIV3|nr:hypothetical protein TVAGG3_0612330 [Trichomonas vaginalis G3]EAY04491.1 hypothetical protein TVAG_453080 [Trichomonas vaginalis G3]KAI5503284.1 hypothetical protein TVAGG3_0612330 [Trichomonas vaginalis G3]|eukprot:XP_001316714.1 hypothetical protein [Trichomonas vaginalis G3]
MTVESNSTPIVDWLSSVKTSSTKRLRRAVFPTPEEPMMMNLSEVNEQTLVMG